MKLFPFAATAILSIAFFAGAAAAQKKTARKTSVKKAAAETRVVPPLDVRAAREKIDNQLENVNRFVDVLGPIAQAIETLEESGKTRPLSRAAAEKNEANKQKVIEAIRNLGSGLANLEAEFRVKLSLQKYLPSIEGIADLGAESEDSALAGRFVAAKEPLRNIARKLSDTLAALPR